MDGKNLFLIKTNKSIRIVYLLFSFSYLDEFISYLSGSLIVEIGCSNIHLEFETFDIGIYISLDSISFKDFSLFGWDRYFFNRGNNSLWSDSVSSIICNLYFTTTIGFGDSISHRIRNFAPRRIHNNISIDIASCSSDNLE